MNRTTAATASYNSWKKLYMALGDELKQINKDGVILTREESDRYLKATLHTNDVLLRMKKKING